MDDSRPRAGWVVPKRHARRAVTRNLVKRQARAACMRHADALGPGLWIVHLRAPLDAGFRSAASPALRDALRREFDRLFAAL